MRLGRYFLWGEAVSVGHFGHRHRVTFVVVPDDSRLPIGGERVPTSADIGVTGTVTFSPREFVRPMMVPRTSGKVIRALGHVDLRIVERGETPNSGVVLDAPAGGTE